MTKQQAENHSRLVSRLESLGFTYTEIQALIRIERTLHRWAEAECNGDIQRAGDDGTGIPYRVYGMDLPNDQQRQFPIPDREAGALRRLAKLMASRPHLLAYRQGDPRGAALYIVPASEVKPGEDISSVYTRGIAVCY